MLQNGNSSEKKETKALEEGSDLQYPLRLANYFWLIWKIQILLCLQLILYYLTHYCC